MDRLVSSSGTLKKLSFSVSRHADVSAWAREGEGLFDLRRSGPFKGVGTLETWANTILKDAWEKGDPERCESVGKVSNGAPAEPLGFVYCTARPADRLSSMG